MFKSLLSDGAVSIDSLILDVFIILGVVIAGALIVYFLWEAVNALIAKSKKETTHPEELNLDALDKKDAQGVSEISLDETKTSEDEVVVLDETHLEEVDEQKAEEEKAEAEEIKSEEDRENAERRAYLEARRQELLRRMQAEVEEETEENTETAVETGETSEEVETVEPEENVESQAVEEKVAVEEVTEETAEVDALEEERKALESEKERYSVMIKELEEAKRALAETQETATTVEKTNAPALSLEELKAKLANAEERLKSTEKEFKQCKKEYIPLRRVWDAHEKDEKKLRRKEALVAKQKVLLYGVNNYADIDEEKAQKLAEDLDLLDGLKLSVQHCEEVMKNNEERYPLLEKMYNVLKTRNDELKNDIATYRAEIERLEAEQTSDEN